MTFTRSSFQSSKNPWSNLCYYTDMVAPFVNGDDKNFSLQINGKILCEWKKLEGNLKKLFAALQANLRSIGYKLEESAFDCVARTNE